MDEAELLFTQVLDCKRQDLYLNRDRKLDKKSSALISLALKERLSGKPIQYILGKTEFMGLEFKLFPGVLIPRPETEILVETAVKITKFRQSFWRTPCSATIRGGSANLFGGHQVTQRKILDVGTGSGCIAISLAKLLPEIEVTAVDISAVALEIAKENAKLNNLEIKFLQSDLFETYDLALVTYDLIVCNPPYIRTSQIKGLAPEVRCQPRIALDGGIDGLDFYRRIINDSPVYLEDKGYLILEIGFNQRKSIEEIIEVSRKFSIVDIIRDYNNIERVAVLQKAGVEYG